MDKLGETLLNKQARCWKNPLHHLRVESRKFQLMGVKNGMKFPQAAGGQPRGVEKCVLMMHFGILQKNARGIYSKNFIIKK